MSQYKLPQTFFWLNKFSQMFFLLKSTFIIYSLGKHVSKKMSNVCDAYSRVVAETWFDSWHEYHSHFKWIYIAVMHIVRMKPFFLFISAFCNFFEKREKKLEHAKAISGIRFSNLQNAFASHSLASLANLFSPGRVLCRCTFVQRKNRNEVNSLSMFTSRREMKTARNSFALFWLFASNFSPSCVPGNIKNELLNAFFASST